MKDKRITDLPADHGIKVGDAAIVWCRHVLVKMPKLSAKSPELPGMNLGIVFGMMACHTTVRCPQPQRRWLNWNGTNAQC